MARGAGELLVTSIDTDGTLARLRPRAAAARSASAVRVPVIASGGAGGPVDLAAALEAGRRRPRWRPRSSTTARTRIDEVKQEVARWGLPMRM